MSWYERFGRSFYDEYWHHAHRVWGFQEFHAKAVEWLRNCKRVVDLGAGYGVATTALVQMGVEAWGIDLSRFACKLAPRRLLIASVEKPPFRPAIFDGIMAIETLEHLDNLSAGFDAVNYLLARPGRVFITVPRPDFPSQEHKWRLSANSWESLIHTRLNVSREERMDDPDRYIFALQVG